MRQGGRQHVLLPPPASRFTYTHTHPDIHTHAHTERGCVFFLKAGLKEGREMQLLVNRDSLRLQIYPGGLRNHSSQAWQRCACAYMCVRACVHVCVSRGVNHGGGAIKAYQTPVELPSCGGLALSPIPSPPSLPHSLPSSLPPSPHPRVSVSGCCDCRLSTTHALRLAAAERLRQLDSRSLQRRVAAIRASLSSPLIPGVQLGNCHRFLFVFCAALSSRLCFLVVLII